MFVVDTNVLVYAADQDSPLHGRCRELLEGWRRQASAWYLTWSILYEFLRVSTHPRVFRAPWSAVQAWEFVEVILDSRGLGLLAPASAGEIFPPYAGEILPPDCEENPGFFYF